MLPFAKLLCFAAELDIFLRDPPAPVTTTIATGPVTPESEEYRVSIAHVTTGPGG